jgi:hypothetical protein
LALPLAAGRWLNGPGAFLAAALLAQGRILKNRAAQVAAT